MPRWGANRRRVAQLTDEFALAYAETRSSGPYAYSAAEVGRRRLAALALGYLNARDTPEAAALAAAQHEAADNMTDEAAAFGCLLANRR